ncbi:HPF/RaiA family ribosome-associated protein [Devosia ginsengisoli]|uniref:HPF/RaiA family ribosome-associated protein n=1 Tax=Devosia ginsengisoli TaxID=400770 RepID=UPI00319D9600
MTLRVSGKNMDVGDALRGKAQDHFAAVVGKYFDGGYDGHLTLTPDGIGFRADCVVHLDTGATLQASAKGATLPALMKSWRSTSRNACAATTASFGSARAAPMARPMA